MDLRALGFYPTAQDFADIVDTLMLWRTEIAFKPSTLSRRRQAIQATYN